MKVRIVSQTRVAKVFGLDRPEDGCIVWIYILERMNSLIMSLRDYRGGAERDPVPIPFLEKCHWIKGVSDSLRSF